MFMAAIDKLWLVSRLLLRERTATDSTGVDVDRAESCKVGCRFKHLSVYCRRSKGSVRESLQDAWVDCASRFQLFVMRAKVGKEEVISCLPKSYCIIGRELWKALLFA